MCLPLQGSLYFHRPIYPMCARVSCVTTDLLHSLCIPFCVHITPCIGQLVSTTCGGLWNAPDA